MRDGPPRVFVDADACPVKREVYKVARRYSLPVTVVANTLIAVPRGIEVEVVGNAFDAADDWIVDHVAVDDLVIADDIPLASRALERGARVLGTRGRPFTAESIGEALGSRELMAYLRESGTVTGGPAPFGKKSRSAFLQGLDLMVNQALRSKARR